MGGCESADLFRAAEVNKAHAEPSGTETRFKTGHGGGALLCSPVRIGEIDVEGVHSEYRP